MKEINICVDDATLAKAEEFATKQSMTVPEMLQKFLEEVISQIGNREAARKQLLKLTSESIAEVGPRTWTRADLHDR